jgi:hypothetical protein
VNGDKINKQGMFITSVTTDTARWWLVTPTGRQVTGTARYCGHAPERVIYVYSTTIMWDILLIVANRPDIAQHSSLI